MFGGIAGIMAGESGEAEGADHMSTLNSKSREMGEIQDMYRRNLAASWSAQPGELRADACIEDIFAGGDGWGNSKHHTGDKLAADHHHRASLDHSEGRSHHGHRRHGSKDSIASGETTPKAAARGHGHVRSASNGRASLEQHAKSLKADVINTYGRPNCEVDEFELREDLRSWNLPGAVA